MLSHWPGDPEANDPLTTPFRGIHCMYLINYDTSNTPSSSTMFMVLIIIIFKSNPRFSFVSFSSILLSFAFFILV